MGTYTANYNLYMPTVGEQGWGDLMNGNLTTIDTTMAGLNTRLTAVENEVNGNLSCTSVTTSGTITSTGVINANDGVKGNVTGDLTGKINVSSYAASGDIKLMKVSFPGSSLPNGSAGDWNRSFSCPSGTIDNITCAELFNYVGDLSEVNCTGTTRISVTGYSPIDIAGVTTNITVTVVDNTTNTTAHSGTYEIIKGSLYKESYFFKDVCTFNRMFSHDYTIALRLNKNLSTYGVTYYASTTTGTVTLYVPSI